MNLLEMKNIKKVYGSHIVLDDVDLTLDKPGIVALVGPNGSGKTTLMNIAANIIVPDSGTVRVFGKSNRDVSIFYDYSYLIDNNVLYDYLTGYDHLKYIADTHKLGGAEIEKAANYLNITHFLNKKISEYSLGMKQQLLFTMSVLNDPKLLVLDEPFNGLDPSTIIKVRKILLDFVEDGKTILLSSHNLSEVDQMTNHIVFVKEGKLIEEDISKYREGIYYFKVKDPNGLKNILNEYNVDYKYGEIIVKPKDENISKLLEKISTNTEVYSVRREEVGTETRYRELFGI